MKQRKLIALLCVLSMLFTFITPVSAAPTIKAGAQEDGSFLIGDFTDEATATAFHARGEEDRAGNGYNADGGYLTLNESEIYGSQGENYFADNADVFGSLDFSDYGIFRMKYVIEKDNWETTGSIKNYFTVVLSTAEADANSVTYCENECLYYEYDLSNINLTSALTKGEIVVPLSEFKTAFDGMVNGSEVVEKKDGTTDLSDIKSISILGSSFGVDPEDEAYGVIEGPGTEWKAWTFINGTTEDDLSCGFGVYEMRLLKLVSLAAEELDVVMADQKTVAKNTTLNLPTAVSGAIVTWSSANESIITNAGVVTMPANDTDVVLTATVTATDGSTAIKTYTIKVYGTNYVKLKAGKQPDGSYLIGDFSDKTTGEALVAGCTATNSVFDALNNWVPLTWHTDPIGSRFENYIYNNPVVFDDLDFSEYGILNIDFVIVKDYYQNQLNNCFSIVLSTAESDATALTYYQNECLFYEVDFNERTLTGPKTRFNLSIPLSDFTLAFDGMKDNVQGVADGKIDLSEIKAVSIMGQGFKGAAKSTQGTKSSTQLFKRPSDNDSTTCGGGLYSISLFKQANVAGAELDTLMADYERFIENTTITLPAKLTGATVSWSSDNESIISTSGVVTIPEKDTVVTLTAAITADDGTTATKTYSYSVFGTTSTLKAGKQADGSYLIGDFATQEMATIFKASGAENTTGGWDNVNKFFTMNWTSNTGSRGEDYIYNHPNVFKDLDFSEYGMFNIKFAIDRTNYKDFPTVENYMTVVLTTAEKDAVPNTFYENECLYYEINLRNYPFTNSTKQYIDLTIPFNEFKVAFDGVANGIAGAKDGKVDLADIKSFSLVAGPFGSRIKNGPGATDSAYWAFTNSDAAKYNTNGVAVEVERCGAGLYSISLLKQASAAGAELDTLMAGYERFYENTTITLPIELTGATVTWSSDNEAVISKEGVVTLPENDTVVTLTASVTANDGTTATKTYAIKVFGSVVSIKAGAQADGSYLIGDFSDKATALAVYDASAGKASSYDSSNNWYTLGWLSDNTNVSRAENYIYNNPVAFKDLDFSEYGLFSMDFAIVKDDPVTYPKINNYFTIVLSTAEKDAVHTNYYQNECLYYEIDLNEYPLTGRITNFNLTVPLSEFTVAFDGMKNGVKGTADGKVDLSEIKSISILGTGFAGVKNSDGGHSSSDYTFKNSGRKEATNCGGGLYNIKLLKQAAVAGTELDNLMPAEDRFTENTTITLPTKLTGATVIWTSDDENIISTSGVVTLPALDKVVTLTASITADDGTTATKTYSYTVLGVKSPLKAGKQADGSFLIGDFSDRTTGNALIAACTATNSNYDTNSNFVPLSWHTDTIGSRFENYIYNHPNAFNELDFSEYGIFNMDFAIVKNLWEKYPNISNWITIVLSTAEKDATRLNYYQNECLFYEIDLSKYTLTSQISEFSLSVPFSQFTVAFDGMKNGVQGTTDGKIDLKDIKSISIMGQGFKRAVNAGELGHLSTTQALKSSSEDKIDTCAGGLRKITLSNYTVSKPVIYSGDAVFTDMTAASDVYGKAECVVSDGVTKKVNAIIALYNGGELKAVDSKEVTLANGVISTNALSYNPENYDAVSVYLWDSATMAPITVKATISK